MQAAFAELTGVDVDRGCGYYWPGRGQHGNTLRRRGLHADNGDLKAKALVIDTAQCS